MRFALIGTVMLLASCGGSEQYFFGGTIVDVDSSGAIDGVSASDLTTIVRGENAFAYGFADNVDATRVGFSAGAASGDRGSFAVAGFLPGVDVGLPITRGEATFSGQYAFVQVTGVEATTDRNQWIEESFAGGFSASVDLEEAEEIPGLDDPYRLRELFISGQSPDGRLVLRETLLADLTGGNADGTEAANSTTLNLTVNGVDVDAVGNLAAGQDGAVAVFAGSGPNVLVSGGFLLGDAE